MDPKEFEYDVYFQEAKGCLIGIQVRISMPRFFWSDAATVTKGATFQVQGVKWEPARFNYSSGGHNKGFTEIETARAKAAALLRAAEIMEELDRLWPEGLEVVGPEARTEE